ncbi:MAG TPA: extracellular solute-binding protein, partial [Spirochaetia bacterium]|nr:extracellular solute-binding protein [Spirochaetia bacterium]
MGQDVVSSLEIVLTLTDQDTIGKGQEVNMRRTTGRCRITFSVLALVTMSVVGIVTVSASGNKEQSAATSGASTPTTIVWTSGGLAQSGISNSSASAAQQLIEAFEKSHPNIKVTLEQESSNVDTARSALTVQISGGATSPDLYGGGAIWPPLMAAAGLAMNLDSVFPDSFWSYTSPDILNGSIYQGHKYAVPTYADVPLLYYRKDLLEAQHMAVPKTWEELQSEAQALIKKGLVKYGFSFEGKAFEGATWSFLEFLHQAGGAAYTSDGKPSVDTPEGRKALGFMRDLITSGV